MEALDHYEVHTHFILTINLWCSNKTLLLGSQSTYKKGHLAGGGGGVGRHIFPRPEKMCGKIIIMG